MAKRIDVRSILEGYFNDCPSTTSREPDIGESGVPKGKENSFILNAGHAPV